MRQPAALAAWMSAGPSPTIRSDFGVRPRRAAACWIKSGAGLRCAGVSAPCTPENQPSSPAASSTTRASGVGLLVTTAIG